MSELLGLEFWSKKDLVAGVERLRADNKAHCTALMTTAMWEGAQDEIAELKAELASVRGEFAMVNKRIGAA